jgi:serine protease Do
MKKALLFSVVGSCALLGSLVVSLPLRSGAPAAAQSNPPSGEADVLAQLEDRFETVARKVSPAVVAIDALKPARPGGSAGPKGKAVEECGSGMIVKLDGHTAYFVLTNNHVIAQALPEQITIYLADGRIFKPSRVWADTETDIALLSLNGAINLPTAVLGDSDGARVGRWVLAIGNPFGLNQTVTHGIISARNRGQVSLGNSIRIKDFLQTDAAINPGSSGGPLVNLKGEVIGLNTAIASHSNSNSGVAFSIPVNLIKRVTKQMLENGGVARGYLGMQLTPSFEAADALKFGLDRVRGAWVERVYPDTPAAVAGLQANDIVLQVESIPIRDDTHLINLISTLPAGQRVRLQVWRERAVVNLDAVVGDWSKAQKRFQTGP